MEVADLYVVLRGVNGEFTKSMKEAGVASERADSKIASVVATSSKMALGFGVAAVAVGVESVKMAAAFDATMERIHTLAGVPQQAIKGLSDGVLHLAGQVGYDPHSLADALYHVESSFASTGITGSKAMDILKVAAQGAKIGGADLVDVTNALDAAIASGIPGVQDYHQAMGALLSIVGSGDMQMQDLANAFSTGILAIGKQYGATLNDVGAALATFGDNNIRGQVAATDLRMSIMDLTKQAAPGVKALASIGIASSQLGRDMQKHGMNAAIIDLRNHLNAAGITGTKVGRFLEDAFTKKSSAPLAVLLGEFDRLESKYPELAKGAHGFADAWARTSEQFKTRLDQIKAQGQAWAIQLGNLLIPILTRLMGEVMKVVGWFNQHKKAAQELGTVIRDFLIGGLVLAGIAFAAVAAEALIAAAPFIIASIAIGALVKWLMSLYEHNAKFHAFVDKIATDVKVYLGEAVTWVKTNGPGIWATVKDTFEKARDFAEAAFQRIRDVVRTVIGAVTGWLTDHRGQIHSIFADISKTVRSFTTAFTTAYDAVRVATQTFVKIAEDLWARFGQQLLEHVMTALRGVEQFLAAIIAPLLQIFRGFFEMMKGLLDVFIGIFTGDWSKFWTGITEIFGGALNIVFGVMKVAWAAIVFIFKEGVNLISTALGAGMAVISALWGLGMHAVETVAKAFWGWLTGLFSSGWNQITSGFSALGRSISRAFDGALKWLYGAGRNIVLGLWNGIVDVVNGMNLAGIANHILGFFKGAPNWLYNAGRDVLTGLWNGMVDMLNSLNLNAIGDGVVNGIKAALGIGSPSKVMAEQVGRWIPAGIAQGISNHAQLVDTAMNGIAGNVAGYRLGAGANRGAKASQFGSASNAGLVNGAAGGQSVFNINIRNEGSVLALNDMVDQIDEVMQQRGFRRGIAYQNSVR